ncbi:MAG TPA: MFS transporter [Streptosporangiaceae bacterium]|nr:MFS transporter [Streptosporangiaceae bacterium]
MGENAEPAGHTGNPATATAVRGRGWAPGDREQVAVVSFSHAIQHCYSAMLGIVYPFALAEFHISYAVLGVVLGATGLAGGLLQGLAGAVRRFPARMLLGGQNLGIAVASALGALSPGFAMFAGARVLGQLASWPQHPVGSAHLTDRVPHRRGLVLAAHTTGGNVGTLVAPIIASAFIAAFSWRWALAAMGALLAASSLVTWARVRTARHQPGDRAAPDLPEDDRAGSAGRATSPPPTAPGAAAPGRDPGPRQPAAVPVTLRRALRRRTAVAILVAGTISAAGRGLGVLTTYIPAYLRDGLHEPALTIGVLVTVVGVGAVAGPMLGGQISDRAGRRTVLYALYGCGAIGLASFVLVGSSLAALALTGLVIGVFSYSEQPVRQALFSDAMEGVSARAAFGAYFAISQSFGALWVTILGFIITGASFRAAFFVMAASFVVAGTVIAVFARDRAGAPPAAPAEPS